MKAARHRHRGLRERVADLVARRERSEARGWVTPVLERIEPPGLAHGVLFGAPKSAAADEPR